MKKILILLHALFSLIGSLHSGITDVPIKALESYMGEYPEGILRIVYAKDNRLTRPFIIIEGFDPGYITKPEEKYGRKSLEDFLKSIAGKEDHLNNTLLGDLSEYDLVYLDFKKGSDYLQRNALLVEHTIRFVNDAKEELNGIKQPNVMLGISMGSVLIRYALLRMENNKEKHQTRLYISADGGMQGSNIPQGYQYLNNHFRDLYISTGATAGLIEHLALVRKSGSISASLNVGEEPAAKQLSLHHINRLNQTDNSMHDAWLAELCAIGYPKGDGTTGFEKVAMSNGSECARPQTVGSGGNLLTWKGKAHTSLFSDLSGISTALMTGAAILYNPAFPELFALGTLPGRNDFKIKVLVNAREERNANIVYKAKIIFIKKILGILPVSVTLTNQTFKADVSTPAYDYYPGGYQDFKDDIKLPSSKSLLLVNSEIILKSLPSCQVPITSSLDIGRGKARLDRHDFFTQYHSSHPPAGIKASPFELFITASDSSAANTKHGSFELRNGAWIAEGFKGKRVLPNICGLACGVTISGDEIFNSNSLTD